MTAQDSERPEVDQQLLDRVWAPPRGLAYFSEVNNLSVGLWYVITGFAFFLAAGIMALIMRLQLAWPLAEVVGFDGYNQLFTMHGTTMMFLFAVPILEGIGIYVVPQLVGARDLPFPRLSAYGYWCYALGGVLILSSFFLGGAPDSGWFMYTPLSSQPYSPGKGSDFWLLGLTFVEISALTAAIELTVGILKFRAPGMTLGRMPVLAWAYLTVAWMIVFAFPPLLVADIMLESERALGTPFFDPLGGGDPVLWQHLFWFFGHPEVYIIFLPAAGIVSLILPVFARRPLVGYSWVVGATVATGVISFALWVHHMYAVGLPHTSLSIFSAASMAVAVPSGIQVFAWLATIWGTRPALKTPMLYILGFLFVFTLGGLTGVMVASVPFDWQVHDTHFVVAHFHYVLIGGMVFPLFAALYYWYPHVTGRLMSERLGRWAFGLSFVGFNVTFFPLHVLGLLGMPRRVYTYLPGLGLDWLNLLATVGAFMMAAGVALFLWDALYSKWRGEEAGPDPWGAGTLEWMGTTPSAYKGSNSLPRVSTRYPRWQEPEVVDAAERGLAFLGTATTGGRETMRVGTLSAEPQQVVPLPGPSWMPLLGAVFTGIFFTAVLYYNLPISLAALAGIAAVYAAWAWSCDHESARPEVEAGPGVRLPTYVSGFNTHVWWGGMVTAAISAAAYFAIASSYVFLWLVSAEWPASPWQDALSYRALGLMAAFFVVTAAGAEIGRRGLGRFMGLAFAAISLLAAAVLFLGFNGLLALDATRHAYPASIWALAVYVGAHVAFAIFMSAFTLLRRAAGLVTARRRMLVDLTALAWVYTALIGIPSVALVALGQWMG